MSLNLGNELMAAATGLKGNPYWSSLREQLGLLAQRKMSESIDSTLETRVEATAYARAMRDLWVAFEAATLEVNQRQVKPPKAVMPAGVG